MSTRKERRIHELLLLVSHVRRNPGTPVSEVAAALGVSPEQLASHVDRLLTCGKAPFQPDDLVEIFIEKDRVYVELDQALGRPLRLTPAEAIALCVALRSVGADGSPAWAEGSAAAEQKIRAALGVEIAPLVEERLRRIEIDGKNPAAATPLATLRVAQSEQRAVAISYYSASRDAVTARTLQPYLLVQHLGVWYAVGHDDRSQALRIFRVDRIREATLGDAHFEIPASFDPVRFSKGELWVEGVEERTAKVLFTPPASRWVVEDWPEELLERRPDGSVVARVDFSHVEGLVAWVLGFGAGAELLEPEDARAAIAAACRAALREVSPAAAG